MSAIQKSSSRSVGVGVWLLVSLLTLVAVSHAAASLFTGVWTGEENSLPAVEVNLHGSGETVGGTIAFYFQQRGEDGKWQVRSRYEVPLLAPKVSGNKLLLFEVEHHKTHGSAELGPDVKFRIELTGTNEARLYRLDNSADSTRGLLLVRRR